MASLATSLRVLTESRLALVKSSSRSLSNLIVSVAVFMSYNVKHLSVPGMAHLLTFWTLSRRKKTPTVTRRKGHTNRTRASSEMAGLEEV